MLIDAAPARAPEGPATVHGDLGSSVSVVSDYIAPAPARHLPQMLLATTIVAVIPLAVSLALRASGVISSGWLSVALAVGLSWGASCAGNAYWRKRGRAGEILFSELLLWGWTRRWRQERELANASRLLDLVNPGRDDTLGSNAVMPDEPLTVERREQLLRQLAGALEGQDVYLNGHSRRVARHATMIARGMGLPSEDVARIRAAAAVHDVGKLLTPKAVLNKPGRLSDAEFDVIKRHPVDGAEMVAALGDPELTRIVRHHHERLDGAGYPDNLTHEEIPLGARIIAVADTFDAITSARPYRDAARHQTAIDILRREAGSQLDPGAVRSFLAYYSGNRPTVVWAIVTSSIRRLVSWLSGDPAAAATLTGSKLAAATAATAAIGAAAGAAPVPVVVHPARRAAVVAHHASARPTSAVAAVHIRSGARLPSTPRVRAAAPRARTSHTPSAHTASIEHRRARHGAKKHSRTRRATPAGSTAPAAVPVRARAVPAPGGNGAARRPTSVNPAGHVNHASSIGAGARSGHLPHPVAPGQAKPVGGNGNAYGHSKPTGNAGSHGVAHSGANASSHGNGAGRATPSAQPSPVASPPVASPPAASPPAAAPVVTPAPSSVAPPSSAGGSGGGGQDNHSGHGDRGDRGSGQGDGNNQGGQGHGGGD